MVDIFLWQIGGAEIGGSDPIESMYTIIPERMECSLETCYQGHVAYIGCRCYVIQTRSLGWHLYILPCNTIPDIEHMLSTETISGSATAKCNVS